MKILLLFACAFMSFTGYSQKVEIPDKNFEQALVDLKIDTDGEVNGYLLRSNTQAVTYLDISNKKIKDLSGIEAFTSLTFLDCSNNNLSNLDLRNNIGLTVIFNDVNDLIHPNTSYMGIVMMD